MRCEWDNFPVTPTRGVPKYVATVLKEQNSGEANAAITTAMASLRGCKSECHITAVTKSLARKDRGNLVNGQFGNLVMEEDRIGTVLVCFDRRSRSAHADNADGTDCRGLLLIKIRVDRWW